MEKRMNLVILGALFLFLSKSQATPLGAISQCSTFCAQDSKFQFDPGVTYRYSYVGNIETSLLQSQDATNSQTDMFVAATADIYVESKCEMVLTLRNVVIGEDTDSSSGSGVNHPAISQELERRSARFSFQDGKIASICAVQSDPTWVVNFKRGILASFQNSMDSITADQTVVETDVSGTCETQYLVLNLSSSDNTVISKSKNLKDCEDRSDFVSSIRTEAYNTEKVRPLLESTQVCTQTIQFGLIMRYQCEERHLFAPFSDDESGVESRVTQILQFQETLRAAAPSIGRTTLVKLTYDHGKSETRDQTTLEGEIRRVLRKLSCDERLAGKDYHLAFGLLLDKLKLANRNTLVQLSNSLLSETECMTIQRSVFHDAISMVGTTASVALMMDSIANDRVSEETQRLWIESLPFIQQPTSAMIGHLVEMMEADDTTKPYLPLSAFISNFCKRDIDCIDNRNVQHAINSFVDNLGYNCRARSENDVQKILLSLKAIGNIGQDFYVSQYLGRCVRNKQTPTSIRLAATDALRRLPCHTNRNFAQNMLQDTYEEVEIRIAAYLALIQCPTASTIQNIIRILDEEPVNQVGSFIWSHLENLKDTTDPFKAEIRNILKDKTLKNFDLDGKKFSKNYEGGYSFETESLDARYESNLVFSPESFVPRSAMINMTINLFGQSVNMFEFGVRAEGFESYLEKILGHTSDDEGQTTVDPRLDSIRDNFKIQSDPTASMYMKMFGNELKYWNSAVTQQNNLNILDILISLAQRRDYNLRHSFPLLDSVINFPTILGMPLKLDVDGSALLDFIASGNLDLRMAAASPPSVDINLLVKPSALVSISATMGVMLSTIETGLRFSSTMDTETSMGAKLEIERGHVLKASFDLPMEKQTVFHAKADVLRIQNGRENSIYLRGSQEEGEKVCTGTRASSALGLKFCYQANSNLPFTMLLEIEKTDSHSGYELEARLDTIKERVNNNLFIKDLARIKFDTPGSRIDRQFLAELTLDKSNMNLEAQLKCPWKHLVGTGSIVNTAEEKKVEIHFTMDGQEYVALVADLDIEANSRRTKYTADVRFKVPLIREISGRGEVIYSRGRSFQARCNIPGLGTSANLQRSIQIQEGRYVTDLEFASPMLNAKMEGVTVKRDGLLNLRNEITYELRNKEPQHFKTRFKLRNNVTASFSRYELDGNFESSQFPYLTTGIVSLLSRSSQNLDASISVEYGAEARSNRKKIELAASGRFSGNERTLQLQQNAEFKWTSRGIDVGTDLKYEHSLMPNNRFLDIKASLSPYLGQNLTSDIRIEEERNVGSGPPKVNYIANLASQTGRFYRYSGNYIVDAGVHKVLLETATQNGSPTVLEVSLRPDLRNFLAKGKLQRNNEEYLIDAGLNYEITANKFLLAALFNTDIPQLNTSSQLFFQLQPNMYVMTSELYLNGKKYLLNTKLKLDGKLECLLKMIYPGRRIILKSDSSFDGGQIQHTSQLSWGRGKIIVLNVDGFIILEENQLVVSPHVTVESQYFENIDVLVEAEGVNDKILSRVKAKYGSSYDSLLELEWTSDFTEARVKTVLLTPHQNYENNTIELGYSFNKFGTNLGFDANARVFHAQREQRGTVQVTADLPRHTNVEVHLENDGEVIHANVQHRLTAVERAGEFKAELSIETPYRVLRELKSDVLLTQDKRGYESSANVVFNNVRLLQHQASFRNKNLEANLFIYDITTGESFAFVDTQFKLNHAPYRVYGQTGWNEENALNLDVAIRQLSWSNVEASLRFTSPVTNLERIFSTLQYMKNTTARTLSTEVEYGPNRQISLEGALLGAVPNSLDFEINTPCPFFRHLKSKTKFLSSTDIRSTTVYIHQSYQNATKLDHNTFVVRNIHNEEKLLARAHHFLYQIRSSENNLEDLIARFETLEEILGDDQAIKNRIDIEVLSRRMFGEKTGGLDGSLSDLFDASLEFHHGPAPEYKPVSGTLQLHSEYAGLANVELNVFNNITNNNINVSASLKVNDADVAVAKLSLDSNSRSSSIDILLSAKYNGDYSASLDVKGSQNIQGEEFMLVLRTPMANLEHIVFDGKTTCTSLSSKCDLSASLLFAPGKEIVLSSHIIARRPLRGSLEITTPFEDLSRIAFQLEFVGSLLEFNSKFKLEIGLANNEKYINGDTELLLHFYQKQIQLDMNLETNFEGYEEVMVIINNRVARAGRAQTQIEIKFPNSELEIENTAFFKDWSHFSNVFSFNGPAHYQFTVSNNGDNQGFVNGITLEIGDSRTEYSGVYQSTGPITGTFVLRTPYDILRDAQLVFTLEKNTMAFESRAELTYFGDQQIFTENSIRFSRGLETQIILRTPYTNDFKVSVTHIGGYNYRHRSEVSYGESAVIFTSEFQLRPIKGFIKLITPFQNIQSLEASIEASITQTGFGGKFRASHNELNYIEMSSSFNRSNAAIGHLEFETNIPSIGHLDVNFTHTIAWPMSTITAVVQHREKYFSLNTGFNTLPIEVHFELLTPYKYSKIIKLRGSVDGNMKACVCQADININKNKVNLMTNWNTNRTFEVGYKVLIDLPFVQTSFSSEGSVEHIWTTERFHTSLSCAVDNDEINFTTEITYDPINGRITLSTPFQNIRRLTVSLSQTGEVNNFSDQAPFNHNLLGEILYEGNLRPWSSYTARTPARRRKAQRNQNNGDIFNFECSGGIGYEEVGADGERTTGTVPLNMDVTFSNVVVDSNRQNAGSGSDVAGARNINSIGLITVNDEPLLDIQMHIGFTDDSNGQFHLKTEYIDNINVLLRHMRHMKDLEISANLKKQDTEIMAGNMTYISDPLAINVNIASTDANVRPVSINFAHEGSSNFETSFRMDYDDKHIFTTEISKSNDPLMLRATFSATHPTNREIEIFYKHSRSNRQIFAEGSISLNKELTHAFDINITESQSNGNLQLTLSPLLRDIKVSFNHNGGLLTFTNVVESQYGTMVYRLSNEFDLRPLKLHSTLTTPIDGFENLAFKVTQRGNLRRSYDSHIELTYKTGKTVIIDAEIRRTGRFLGSLAISTPIGDVRARLRHQLEDDKMKSVVTFDYGSKTIEGELLLHLLSRPRGWFEVKTPFRGFRNIRGEFKYDITNDLFTTFGTIDVESKLTSVNIYAMYEDWRNMEGSFTITTPFEGAEYLEISGENHETASGFKSMCKLILPEDTVIHANADYQQAPFRIFINSSCDLQQIRKMEVAVTHVGHSQDFQTNTTLRYDDTVMDGTIQFQNDNFNGMTVIFGLQTPFSYLQNLKSTLQTHKRFTTPRKIQICINEEHEILFMSDFPVSQTNRVSFEVDAMLKSPHVGGMYSLELSNIDTGFEAVLDVEIETIEEGRVAVLGAIKNTKELGKRNLQCELWARTPFDACKKLSLMVHHFKHLELTNNVLNIEYNDKGMKFETEISERENYSFTQEAYLSITRNENAVQKDLANNRIGYKISAKKHDYASCPWILNCNEFNIQLRSPFRVIESYINGTSEETALVIRWDASRDNTKEISLAARQEATREGNSYDFQLRSPLLDHDITLSNDIVVYAGNTLFMGRHQLRYSNDLKKHLYLVSKMLAPTRTRPNYLFVVEVQHLESEVDFRLTSKTTINNNVYNSSVDMFYLASDHQMKKLWFYTTLDKPAQALIVKGESPLMKIHLDCRIDEGLPLLTLKVEHDEHKYHVTGDEKNASYIWRISTNSADVLVNLPISQNERGFKMAYTYQRWASENGGISLPTQDVQFYDVGFTLDTSDNIYAVSNFYWQDDALTNGQLTLAQLKEDIAGFADIANEMLDSFYQESRSKYRKLLAQLPDPVPLNRFVNNEVESFMRQYNRARRMIGRLYMNDEFYLKTLQTWLDSSLTFIRPFIVEVKNTLVTAMGALESYASHMANDLSSVLSSCKDSVVTTSWWLGQVIIENAIFITAEVTSACDHLYSIAVVKFEGASEFIDECFTTLLSNLHVEELLQRLKSISFSIPSGTERDLRVISDYARALGNRIGSIWQQCFNVAQDIVNVFPVTTIRRAFERSSVYRNVQAIDGVWNWNTLRSLYDDAGQAYGDISRRMETRLVPRLEQFVARGRAGWTRESIQALLYDVAAELEWVYQYLDEMSERHPLLNAVVGHVEDSLIQLQSFNHTVSQISQEYHLLKVWIPSSVPDLKFERYFMKLANFSYHSVPSFKVLNWLPTYDGVAILSKEYIITFDNTFIPFDGSCDSTLSYDVVDASFVLYYNSTSKSMALVTGRQRMEIVDGVVSIDGTAVAVPYESDSVKVSQKKHTINIESSRGISVAYNSNYQLYMLKVSGLLHGKVVGLLGTYTNEQYDDLTTPTGNVANAAQEFIRSWDIFGDCSFEENVNSQGRSNELPISNACNEKYESLEVLTNYCSINPAPFMEGCEKDIRKEMKLSRSSLQQGAVKSCTSIASYMSKCHLTEKPLFMPQLPKFCDA